jgi:phasin family protein
MSTKTHSRSKKRTGKAGHTTAKMKFPVLNIEKLLERFKLPGIDLQALAQAQRKNIAALREANRKVLTGAMALTQRQTQILEQTMREVQATAKAVTAKRSAHTATAKPADLAKKAVGHALTNMRELAEMAANSQAQAYDVIGKRVQASIREFRDYIKRPTA